MKIRSLFILCLCVVMLTACGSSPVATEKPRATTPATAASPKGTSYPAPTAVVPTQLGYPGPAQAASKQNTGGYPAPAGLQVVKPDGSLWAASAANILSLPVSKVTVDGKEQQYRKLTDLLNQAGISSFTKITLTAANGTLTFTREQSAEVYIEVASNGAITVPVTSLAKDKWLVGLSLIKIE